jgi:NitT/TauT family transport system ATP-binding protein
MANELGFVNIGVGDVIITDKGIEFLESNFKRRKEIIKESLARIEPFKTAKELKEFTIESLNKALLKKGIADFNSNDGKHKLELILNEWGVYSGFLTTNNKYKVSE